MKQFSFFPYYNRSQRRGIILLFILIFFLQIFIIFQDKICSGQQPEEYNIPLFLQQQYDSLKKIALLKKQKRKIYPFNPNYLTDYKGYYLGMSVEEIDKVFAFRKKGKYFKSKLEFKQISGISDSLFQVLKPFINIPIYKNYSQKKDYLSISTTDINRATALDLCVIKGVGEVLSKRIIKYRNAIGGFTQYSQLNNVYGLKEKVVQRIWKRFKIMKSSTLDKKISRKKYSINLATIKELQKIYGIGEKLSYRIIKYRDKIGGFVVKEQLNDVYGLSSDVIERIWEYYTIENLNTNIEKVNLNKANIIKLAKNPYITYQLAKKIISYRTINGAFTNFEALLKVEDYPADKHKLICLYLTL